MPSSPDVLRRIQGLSIRWKIFLSMMAVAIAVTVGVQQFALREQETIIKDDVKGTGQFIAATLADHIAELLAQSQYLEIREILAGMQQRDRRIVLIAIKDLSTPKKEVVAAIGDADMIAATSDVYDDRIVSYAGTDHYIFFKPIQIRGVAKLLGTVHIGLSLDFMRERLKQTRDSMVAIMLLAVALAAALALVVSNTLLRPLERLSNGILKIAGGQFSHQIDVKSGDEIGTMARMFNRMTENLRILQEVSRILTEQAGPQEVLGAVLERLAKNISGSTGAVVFRGLDGEELVAGNADESSLFFLRKLKQAGYSETGEHPRPLMEPARLCFPFFSEGEITGGVWMVRAPNNPIDEVDERLLSGVSIQLESTLSKLEFQYRSVTDAMTGLYNHRYFQQELVRQMERSQRLSGVFTLVMADVDHFKKINDTYGHQQGDVVLRAVAGAIRKSMRGKVDVPCRYGGEEFGMILPDTTIEGAKIFADRLRVAVEELTFDFNGEAVKCTISIGLATFPDAASDKRLLIEVADRALYTAKESGRNRVKTYKDIS